jgi:putative membrane protein
MTAVGDVPSDRGTLLAADRTRLAYERTMMAWIRTSTSLISFGFAIHKFFQYRVEHGAIPPDRLLGPAEFGGLLIVVGLITLALASVDHRRSMNRMRAAYGPMQGSVAAVVGIFIASLGLLALLALVFGF